MSRKRSQLPHDNADRGSTFDLDIGFDGMLSDPIAGSGIDVALLQLDMSGRLSEIAQQLAVDDET